MTPAAIVAIGDFCAGLSLRRPLYEVGLGLSVIGPANWSAMPSSSPGWKTCVSLYRFVESATDAIFAWQTEVLKFTDMRLCANMKLLSDVAEAKDASGFARIQAEHLFSLYEHVSDAAVGYSRRVENILREDS
jgi:hypothetical protein